MTSIDTDLVHSLAGLGIFRDFSTAEISAVAESLDTVTFREGQRIIRRGQDNATFYLIVEGEAAVFIDDDQRGLLTRGSFFGEVSALLSEPATAENVTAWLGCAGLGAGGCRTVLVGVNTGPLVTETVASAELFPGLESVPVPGGITAAVSWICPTAVLETTAWTVKVAVWPE